jgi:hypothetical protein
MHKIAVFYMIGQFNNPNWKKDFFDDQMNVLKESGLYDEIQFIDIFFDATPMNYIPIEDIPDKTNNFVYYRSKEEAKPHYNTKYNLLNHAQQKIWLFSHANPEYKILFFGPHGITHFADQELSKRKYKWRKYMETLLIKNWKQSIDLLEYYDCVGTDYIEEAVFINGTVRFKAPHYPGHFWWANARYISRLNPLYSYQAVPWQPWLCELWIGSENPKAYNYYSSGMNQYFAEIDPPFDEIMKTAENHLKELRNV